MSDPVISVLLVEDNAGDARLIQELLHDAAGASFEVQHVDRLTRAIEYVGRATPAVILLDLGLPDSQGLDTFASMHVAAPTLPIIVLTGFADESLGSLTVHGGAQDYLTKGDSDGKLLARSIRYAIERNRGEAEVRAVNEHLEQRVVERTSELAAANTELLHHRRELQDFIDAMSALNAKIALDGTVLLVNRIAQRSSGVSLETLLRSNLLDRRWWAFNPQTGERVRSAFQRATEGNLITYEESIVAYGKVITVLLSFVPVKDANGRVEYIVAEGRDITRRVEVEEALKAANQELESFTYSVSHDLRAPIRQIDGFSRLLTEQFESTLDPKAQHYLQRIRDSTQHMGRLVDDLLRLAQVGRQSIRPRSASLDELVESVVADVQADLADRDVQWKIERLPTVECDPGLMKVVFTNLVANAVKYTRPRHPAVIEVGQTSHNGRPVIFVRDNGVGFDMQYADRLFGVFQRLHRAEEFEGTGVGLATVQRIVHKHGGEIWAESQPDNGAAFYFTIGTASATPGAVQ